VALYYLLPLDRANDDSAIVVLAIALPAVTALIVWQVHAILHSAEPRLRAVEALAVTVPLLVLSFATTYYLMGDANPSTFSEPLSRTDALYFSMTIFATVGFGDIVATTDSTRIAVTVQMVVNLLALGIGIRIILGAVQMARRDNSPTSARDGRLD
jgi:hypothetical protein